MKNPYIIAEVGCNHMGDIEIAHKMISIAASCGVNAVKFQKRTPKELLTEYEYHSPHPNPINSFGDTYGEHREYLEFDETKHKLLKQWCEESGVDYSSSVWDLTSAKTICNLHPRYIKVPSATNTDYKLLSWLCDNYCGEIQISLGMTNRDEETRIINLFSHMGRLKDVVLFSCVSGYPVSYEDVSMLEIKRLAEKYGEDVKGIGFSGHHIGIGIDAAALALGATYMERHFTIDKSWKGTDHAASINAEELKQLVSNLKSTAKALTFKRREILPIEEEQRRKLKKHI